MREKQLGKTKHYQKKLNKKLKNQQQVIKIIFMERNILTKLRIKLKNIIKIMKIMLFMVKHIRKKEINN